MHFIKSMIVVFTCLIFTNLSIAQKTRKHEIKYITLDYLTEDDQSYTYTENYENSIGIKILNVNKKLVTVSNQVTSTSFHTEVPAAFKAFGSTALPEDNSATEEQDSSVAALADVPEVLFGQINLDDIRKPISDEAKAIEEDFKRIVARIERLNASTSAFLANYKKLKRLVGYQKNLISLTNTCNTPYTDIEKKFKEVTTSLLISDEIGLKIVLSEADVTQAGQGDLIINRSILERYIDAVIENAETANQAISSGYTDANLEEIKQMIADLNKRLEKLITTAKKIKVDPKTPVDERSLMAFDYAFVIRKLGSALNQSFDFHETLNIEELKKNVELFKTEGKDDLFETYDSFNESNYTVIIPPVTLDGDLTVFTVNIVPKDDVPCAPKSRSYNIRIRTKSGIKIDFSTGLFGNFGSDKFNDQSYHYESVDDNTTRIEENDHSDNIYPTLGALMHIYRRNGRDFQPAACFGLSTKNLDKINIHLGGSLIFGFSPRFIVSGGVTLGKANQLSNEYEVGQELVKSEAPQTIPTKDYNRMGFFVGLTYNLSKK